MNPTKNDAKKLFLAKGTCSQLFFYIMNREYGHQNETEERAADTLAGGIMRSGHQCGMLWGASLGVGAESFLRYGNGDRAIATAITATQYLVESFSKTAKSVNCHTIIKSDWTSVSGILKYLFTGKLFSCLNLAKKWSPEAIQVASEALQQQADFSEQPVSCATEVAKKMGASDEQMVTVAGFAGGLGLSGNACGALSAAIWIKSLTWCTQNPGKTAPLFNNSEMSNLLKAFGNETNATFSCQKITGQNFKTIDEHTQYINNGGCEKLIALLAR